MYTTVKATYADSTLLFEGKVQAVRDFIALPTFDTTLLKLRKQQLIDFHTRLSKRNTQNKRLLEKVVVNISQVCLECPGRDYRNYPLDSLLNVQFVKINVNKKVSYGVYNPKKGAWEYVSPNADTARLRKDYHLIRNYFLPSKIGNVQLYAQINNESQILVGRIILSLSLSAALVLMVLFSFLYFVREVSKQKKLSAIKNDFINNMTHEFKTPIANIILGVDNIENKKVIHQPNLVKNFSDVIRKESIRLNQLVESVLETAQLEQHKVALELQEVDVHNLLQDTIKAWQMPIK